MTTTAHPTHELIHRLVVDLARATGTNETSIRFRYRVDETLLPLGHAQPDRAGRPS